MGGENFGFPPEYHAVRIEAGDHGASLQATSDVHSSRAALVTNDLTDLATLTAGSLASSLGITTASATAVHAAHAAWLALLEESFLQLVADQVACHALYQTTRAGMVPLPEINANRTEEAEAEASNIFGFRTPEIMALNADYFGRMWITNAGLQTDYDVQSAVLSAPKPVLPSPLIPGSTVSESADFAAAVGKTAASTAAHDVMEATKKNLSSTSMPSSPASNISPPDMSSFMSMPSQMMQQVSQIPSQLGQNLGSMTQMPSQMMGQLGQLGQGTPLSAPSTGALSSPPAATKPLTPLGKTLPSLTSGAGSGAGGGLSGGYGGGDGKRLGNLPSNSSLKSSSLKPVTYSGVSSPNANTGGGVGGSPGKKKKSSSYVTPDSIYDDEKKEEEEIYFPTITAR